MIHLRFEGRSYDLNRAQVKLGANSSDREIKETLARHLDVSVLKFQDYVVDRRPNGTIIVRPEAVYG